MTYYDFRTNDTAQDLKTHYFIVRCNPSAGSWRNPGDWSEDQLTDGPFDMRQAPFARGFFVGDYAGLTANGYDFLAVFSQAHGSDLASVFFSPVSP